jgi:predicted transcriptional regulator
MKKYFSKTIAAAVLMSVILSLAPRPLPAPTAQATIPVIDPAVIFQMIREYIEKQLLASLKKRLLDMLVNQTVAWIQGQGKPKFITNWKGFLKDAGQKAVGDFVKNFEGGALSFLCEPFKLNIKVGLLPIAKFGDKPGTAACTLDKIVGNIEDYYKDFRKGGFAAFAVMTKDNNNFLSVHLNLQARMMDEKYSGIAKAMNEGLSGGGFLAEKKCEKDKEGKDIPETCKIITPGRTLGDAMAKAVGSDIDFLVNAQELSDYVAAIGDAFLNRVIYSSLTGAGIAKMNTPGVPESVYVDPETARMEGPCAGLTGKALELCVQLQRQNTAQFEVVQSEFLAQIDTVLIPLKNAASSLQFSIVSIQGLIEELQSKKTAFNNLSLSSCFMGSGFNDASFTKYKNDAIQGITNDLFVWEQKLKELQADYDEIKPDLDQLQSAQDKVASFESSQQITEAGIVFSQIKLQLTPQAKQAAGEKEAAAGEAQTEVVTQVPQITDKWTAEYKKCVKS